VFIFTLCYIYFSFYSGTSGREENMPWENNWIPNEVAFEIGGFTIYHTYRENEMSQGVHLDRFTLDEMGDEESANIRVKNYPMPENYEGPKEHPQYLCKPENWPGSYEEWKATDRYRELEEAWKIWHATEEGRTQAILTNAIAQKLAPFNNPPEPEQETIWQNKYECSECGERWEDEWSCPCNDRCPCCNAEIEPYESTETQGE